MAGQGFYGGNNQPGEGFYIGASGGYVDITVDLRPIEPVLSLTAEVITAEYVDLHGSIVLPPEPELEITGTLVSGPGIVPVGLPAYASGLHVLLTMANGAVRDVGAEAEKLTTSRARKYGYENCTFELPSYLIKLYYDELAPFVSVQVIRDGITRFEGRITEPGISIGTTDSRRKISARGRADGLKDNEAVRACYADSDFSSWRRPTKTPKHDFSVDATSGNTGVIGAGNITAQAKWGSTYAAAKALGNLVGAWGDVCWWLYGGIPILGGDAIAGVELHYRWKGDLDPTLIKTNKLPLYNLFPDPRNQSGAQHWQLQDPDLKTPYKVKDVNAETLEQHGGQPGAVLSANAYRWDGATFGELPTGYGALPWLWSLALPSEYQTKAKADGGIVLGLSLWTAGNGNGDSVVIFAKDGQGNPIGESYGLGLPQSPDWSYITSAGVFPAETSELVVVADVVPGPDNWRSMCFPYLGIPDDQNNLIYQDGFSDGWEWSSKANDSPSRETDLTVTNKVLDAVKVFVGATPLWATLFASNDPGAEPAAGVPALVDQLAFWADYEVASGYLSVECGGYTGLGVSIAVVGCPYTLQFSAPPDDPTMEPYGLVIDSITVYAAAGMGDDGIGVLDCMRDMVCRGAALSAGQLDFPDGSDLKALQLVFDTAATAFDDIATIDKLLDWEYGFRENGTFYYYDPERIKADPRCVYQLPYSKSLADLLTTQTDDLCNGVEVTWTHADGITPGSVQIKRHSDWVPDEIDKIHHIDAPSEATHGDAVALAGAYLDEHTVPQVTGTLPLSVTRLRDLTGTLRNVGSMREGEYIRLTEQPPEERAIGDLLISRITEDHDQMQMTIEVGMNRKRLDRQLARLDAKVVRR